MDSKHAAAAAVALAAEQFIDAVLQEREDGQAVSDQADAGELGYFVTFSTRTGLVVASSVTKREQTAWLGYVEVGLAAVARR